MSDLVDRLENRARFPRGKGLAALLREAAYALRHGPRDEPVAWMCERCGQLWDEVGSNDGTALCGVAVYGAPVCNGPLVALGRIEGGGKG